jgi:protein TonB
MTTATLTIGRPLDWSRIGAWSGSFAAHAAVLLLIALPMTTPPPRPVQTTVIARWIEPERPPRVLSEPPPPTVPVRPKPVRAHPATPVPAASTRETALPIPVADSLPQRDTAPADPPPLSGDDSRAGGATRMLAYATPLRPRYPAASVRAHEEGTVVLRVLVDAAGAPQRVEIAKSSGHARLDEAARESIMAARFRPVLRDGEATPAWGLVPIAFRLDRG